MLLALTFECGVPGIEGSGQSPPASVAGTWDTTEGRATLSQQGADVSGTIAKDNGRIRGTLRGDVLEGTWVEDYSAQRCATAAWDGGWYWGRFRWTFTSDGRFTGAWSYCDGPFAAANTWSGTKVAEAPSTSPAPPPAVSPGPGSATGGCQWRVHEMEVGTPFEWTWTRRGSSDDYDGVKRNTKTGKVENFLIRLYEKRADRSVAFGRLDFAGRYRGRYSEDGQTARGYTDWGGGEWTAEIVGCGLAVAPEPGVTSATASSASTAGRPTAGPSQPGASPVTSPPTPPAPVQTPSRTPASPTTASPVATPAPTTASASPVSRQVPPAPVSQAPPAVTPAAPTAPPAPSPLPTTPSPAANQPVASPATPPSPRPTPSSSATPPVSPSPSATTTPATKAPAVPDATKTPEIYVDTEEDMGAMTVFRFLTYGPFLMKAETSWKDSITDKVMTLTWAGDLLKTPRTWIRFPEEGVSYRSAPERALALKTWKTPAPNASVVVAGGKLGAVAVECVRRDQSQKKTTVFECYADDRSTLYRLTVETPGQVNQWPAAAQAVLDTLQWVKKPAKYTGLHPIEKAIAALPTGGGVAPGARGPDVGFAPRRVQSSTTADQYEAAVLTAAAGFRELAGPMTPAQRAQFDAQWADFLNAPSPEKVAYVDALVPVVEEVLAARESSSYAAVAFDRAWMDAVAAATVDDEEGMATALAVAEQQEQLLRSLRTRLARLVTDVERVGNPPTTPKVATGPAPSVGASLAGLWINDKITQGFFALSDGTFGQVECIGPEMGCDVHNWVLTRQPSGEYVPSTTRPNASGTDWGPFTITVDGDVLRWKTDSRARYFAGDYRRIPTFTPPVPYATGEQTGGDWPCDAANAACREEYNAIRKYTAMAVAQLQAKPPATLAEARKTAMKLSAGLPAPATLPTTGRPPRSEQEVREAIAEHQVWVQAIEKMLAKDRADLAKAKTAAEQDLLQWRIVNAEANLQAERDLIRSLETGTYVHTRTRLDDGLHAQMIDRSREYNARVDQARRYAEGLMRLADSAATPDAAQKIRDAVARELTPAAIAAGDLETAERLARAADDLVQHGNEAAGAAARDRAETEDTRLFYAQATKTVASVALAVLAPAAVADLGFTVATNTYLTYGAEMAYGGVTGYIEGGKVDALKGAIGQAGLAGAVAAEAFEGYQQAGGRGAAKGAVMAFLGRKLVDYGASKASGVYAWMRGVPVPPQKLQNITIEEWRTHVQVLNAKEDAQRLIGLFKQATGERRRQLAAEINSNYMAKLLIKKGGAEGPGRPLETDWMSTVKELYRTRVDPAFNAAVAQKKIRWQQRGPDGKWRDVGPPEFREFRQKTARETGNTDRDFGLVERDPSQFRLTMDGEPIRLRQAQETLQDIYDPIYSRAMFGQDPKKAFQNITTSASGDAYRQRGFTRLTTTDQPNMWRDPWAQQAADVAREKVREIDELPLPAAQKLIEKARTAAKEIEQRVLTQLNRANADPAKIAYWKRVQQSLKTMVDDPVAGQRALRITSGADSVGAVTDSIATAIEALNKLGR